MVKVWDLLWAVSVKAIRYQARAGDHLGAVSGATVWNQKRGWGLSCGSVGGGSLLSASGWDTFSRQCWVWQLFVMRRGNSSSLRQVRLSVFRRVWENFLGWLDEAVGCQASLYVVSEVLGAASCDPYRRWARRERNCFLGCWTRQFEGYGTVSTGRGRISRGSISI